MLADNRWLAQVIGDLRKILKLARLQQLHAPGRLEQSLSEHLAVFAALKARDSEGAEAAMRTHLNRQREALRDRRAPTESEADLMNASDWITRSVSRLRPGNDAESKKPAATDAKAARQRRRRRRRPAPLGRAAGSHPAPQRRGAGAARAAPCARRTAGGGRPARERGRGRPPRRTRSCSGTPGASWTSGATSGCS